MAQNVTIAGASYTDVTAIEVPKTTSGVASFHDVTDTTATASDVLSGKSFYNASGVKTSGSIATKSSSNLTVSGATVTAPAGYYASSASKSVASGSAKTPATTITSNPSISVSSGGLITASNSKTQSVTPTVTAGYVSSGTAGTITVSGSNTQQLTTKAAATYTPGTTAQTIASGQYLTGAQTISGDANLVPANIAQGVSIFGVTGTHAGSTIVETALPGGGTHLEVIGGLDLSNDTVAADRLLYGYTAHDKSGTAITGALANTTGTSVEWNDVNFYDYDGTRLYSYSAAEFASLTAMPPNPTHAGLTSQGWNWSLANAKAQVAGSGGCDIGQMYITSDGKTRLYITIDKDFLRTFRLGFNILGTVTVDWGDGSAVETVTCRSDDWYFEHTNFHTYSQCGDYVISITVGEALEFYSENNGPTQLLTFPNYMADNDAINLYSLYGILRRIEIGENVPGIGGYAFYDYRKLKSIAIPNTMTYFNDDSFTGCADLKYITFPSYENNYIIVGEYAFYMSGIEYMSIPGSDMSIGGYAFQECRKLKSVACSRYTSVQSYAFDACESIDAFILPNDPSGLQPDIALNSFSISSIIVPSLIPIIYGEVISNGYGLYEIHFRRATPPTLVTSDIFSQLPIGCKIYVPTGSLSAYTSATNYPSSSTYTYIEE